MLRWISGVCLLALSLLSQASASVTFAWPINTTHASVTLWEVRIDHASVVPCIPGTVTATERRCTATVPQGTHTFAVRGLRGEVPSNWSQYITETVGTVTGARAGPFTIRWHSGVVASPPIEPKPVAYTLVHSDTFTDTAGVALESHAPDVGTGYTLRAGGVGAGSFQISSSGTMARVVGSGFYEVATPHGADQAAEYTVIASAEQDVDLFIRCTYNSGAVDGYRITGNGLNLRQFTGGGAGSTLAQGATALTAGQVVRVEMAGTVITAYIDGVQEWTYDTAGDGSPIASGTVHVAVFRSIDGFMDNFKVYEDAGGVANRRRRFFIHAGQ